MKLSFSPLILFLALDTLDLVSGCKGPGRTCFSDAECCGSCTIGGSGVGFCTTDPSPPEAPTGAPPPPPSPPEGWEAITFDSFEDGWGPYTDEGDDDARRVDSKEAIRIRREGAFYHQDGQDCRDYTNLMVQFSFSARNLGDDESFYLEYSSDNGQKYNVVKRFFGRDLEMETMYYYHTVYFDDSNLQGPLQLRKNGKIRFRIDSSGRKKRVFIYDVLFAGKLEA